LRRTIDLNQYGGRVTLNELALASHPGSITFYHPVDTLHSMESTMVHRENDAWQIPMKETTVPAITLDGYCSKSEMGRIRLVKIDVEGAELEILTGAAQAVAEHRFDAMICEFAPILLDDPLSTWTAMVGLMESAGYGIYHLGTSGNLVAAGSAMPGWDAGNVCFVLGEGDASA
jgi:FkbM family methyltransferase